MTRIVQVILGSFCQNIKIFFFTSVTAPIVVAMGFTMLAGCASKPLVVHAERPIKKKIVITGFAVNKPVQVEDIDDIAQGIPRELLSRLEKTDRFLTRQSRNLLSFDFKQELGQVVPGAKLIKQVAAEHDAQFVVSGEIRNAGARVDSTFFGLWETRKRHIEIEFAIYDGLSGAFLARHHLYRPAEDDAKVGRDKPFGSVAFYATSYGRAIDALLEESTAWIVQDLAPFPMMAKILKVTDTQILFDAGATTNISVGQVGLIVSDYDQLPNLGLTANQSSPMHYGIPQASMGRVAVVQVQYPFSIGEMAVDVKKQDVKVGDYIRFDPPIMK